MASKKEKLVSISLYVHNDTLAFVDAVTPTGILGATRNDVIVHMIRQFVFESWLQARKSVARQEDIKAPATRAAKAPAKKITASVSVAKKTGKKWTAKKAPITAKSVSAELKRRQASRK